VLWYDDAASMQQILFCKSNCHS